MRDRSKAAIIGAAQRALAQANATDKVAVVWAGLDESQEALSKRLAVVRRARAGRILAAVPHGYTVPAGVELVPFAAKMFRLLHPAAPNRYRVGSGGRGSGKSHAFSTAVILYMLAGKRRVLCCREIMRSLRESVHHLLVDKIDQLKLNSYFDVTDREIACKLTGAEAIFAGLWANLNSLKSLENIGLCWIEEAESVSARSLEVLAPTIRDRDSELWMSCNPDDPAAPVQDFVEGKRPDSSHVHVTFDDNPWFPEPLKLERDYLQRVDDDAYRHVWLGQCRSISDAQVFKNKYTVEEFAPAADWSGPHFGADWGFSQDPTTLVKAWIHDRVLYIEYEAFGVGVDIDRTPAMFDAVPGARNYTIRADSARPETISYMQRNGYGFMQSVAKWSGSVEDGIAHIRSYERVVIHPRCTHAIEEFRLYSFKVDKLSGDIQPVPADRHNHIIDALRYALTPMIKSTGAVGLIEFWKRDAAKQQQAKANLAARPGVIVTELTSPWHRP